MKIFILSFSVIIVCFLAQPLHAQRTGWGLGLVFGEPTGFTAKKWIDQDHAITGGIAYSTATINDGLSLNANYVWNQFHLSDYHNNFGLQYGVGFRFNTRSSNDSQFGLRGTLEGIWYPEHFPCDFFLEVAPVFVVAPSTGIALDLNAGLRFYIDSSHDH
jgi:hypothetical protein